MPKTDRRSGKPPAYEVGYGRPPKATQFKPGQSGNPNGRPKGRPSLDDLLLREGNRHVRIQMGDSVQSIPRLDAVVLNMFTRALKGDSASLRILVSLLAAAHARRSAEELASELEDTEVDLKLDEAAMRRMLARVQDLVGDGE